MLEDPADADRADKLCRSARDYLGIELTHLGVIFRDELQSVALSSRIPMVRWKPGSVLSRAIYRISEKVLRTEAADRVAPPWAPHAEEQEPAAPATGKTDAGALDDPAALEEAEADFRVLRQDVEDLLSSGALSMPDLVEAVRSQQVEIDQLRRENALLKARIPPARPE
jgi:flagellar biosynthesis protein FlhG